MSPLWGFESPDEADAQVASLPCAPGNYGRLSIVNCQLSIVNYLSCSVSSMHSIMGDTLPYIMLYTQSVMGIETW